MRRLLILFSLIFSLIGYSQSDDVFKIVLDAGHGGKDPGKVSHGFKEKDVALNIVLLAGKELEKHKNIKVIYTRKHDTLIDLRERGVIANRAKADLFISVHCNAHHTQAHGAETYVLGLKANNKNFEVAKAENEVIYLEDNYEAKYAGYDINSPESFIGLSIMQEQFLEQSIQLAKMIQDNFKGELKRHNRGVKQAAFIVLHQTYMPSVLIETGFITNTAERKFLISKEGQKQFANSIAKVVLSYRDWVNKSSFKIEHHEHKPEIKPAETSSITGNNITYKVQIATTTRDLPTKPYNFKGLRGITKEKSGRVYRYFYGVTSDYNQVKRNQRTAVAKGFKDCFIVAYKDGKKISLEEAIGGN